MTACSRRHPSPRAARRAAGALVLALAAAWPAAGAAQLTADALVTWEQARQDDVATSSLDQLYTLRFRQQVYQPLSYQLELGVNDLRSRTSLVAGSTHGQRFLPRGSLDVAFDRIAIRGSYDGALEATSGSVSDGLDAWMQRGSTFFNARPLDGLQLSATAMDTARRDAAGTVDVNEGTITAGAAYTRNDWVLTLQNAVNLTDDRALLFSRTFYTTGGTARYARAFGMVNVGARYGFQYTSGVEETTASTPIEAPRQLAPAAGLYEVNDLPTSSTGMTATPALVDDDLLTSAGIALGPDGRSFQNLGVDLGRVDAVDGLEIFVRDASGRPIDAGQGLVWTAYVSNDGRTWQLAQSTAEFIAAASAYAVRFTRSDARFVKVVNLGTHVLPTYVTEVQAFVHELVNPDERRTRSFLVQSGAVTLDARPRPWMKVSYNGRASFSRSRTGDAPSLATQDWSQTVGTILGPFSDATLDLAYALSLSDASVSSRRTHITTALLRYEPLPTLNVTGRTAFTADMANGFTSTTLTEGVTTVVSPLPTLRVQAAADATQQRRSEVDGLLEYFSTTLDARARLTSTLTTSVAGSGQWTLTPLRTDAVGSPLPTLLVFQRYWTESTWTPSGILSIRARVGYVSTTESGIFQNYYLGWQPLQGGAITIMTTLDTDVDAVDGRWARRASLGTVWEINPRVRLEVTASRQSLRRDDVDGVRSTQSTQTIFTTFNARL
jgi:hypothetical protein